MMVDNSGMTEKYIRPLTYLFLLKCLQIGHVFDLSQQRRFLPYSADIIELDHYLGLNRETQILIVSIT